MCNDSVLLLLCVVAVDGNSGRVYVTGYAQGTLDGQTFAGGSVADIVLMKYNSSGAWQWTRLRGTTNEDVGYGGEYEMRLLATGTRVCDV